MTPTNIAYYRRLRGMTQAELADRVGVRQPHISRIESGDDGPPLSLFQEIATALGVPLAALFEDRLTAAELALIQVYRDAGPEVRLMLAGMVEAAERRRPAHGQ